MRISRYVVLSTLVLLASNSLSAFAAEANFVAVVKRVATYNNDDFGGCMARTNPGPQTVLPSCGNNYVTFDCADILGEGKTAGNNKFASAQLAFVTGKNTSIRVSENSINGICSVVRIEVLD